MQIRFEPIETVTFESESEFDDYDIENSENDAESDVDQICHLSTLNKDLLKHKAKYVLHNSTYDTAKKMMIL